MKTKQEAAKRLHADGYSYNKIAQALGVSLTTAHRYVDDEYNAAQLARARERKKHYRGTCIDCGKSTSYSGRGTSGSLRCNTCARKASKYWTQERIIEAIRRWAKEHGRPPSSIDWNASLAKKPRGEGYPAAGVVYGKRGAFKLWADAIEAAGFSRPKPTYRRYKKLYWTQERIIEALRAHAQDGVAPRGSDWNRSAPGHPTGAWVAHMFGTWKKACHAAGLLSYQEAYYHGRSVLGAKKMPQKVGVAPELIEKRIDFVRRLMDDYVLRNYIVDRFWSEWGFTSQRQFKRWLTKQGISEHPGYQFRAKRQLTNEEIAEGSLLASEDESYRLDRSEV